MIFVHIVTSLIVIISLLIQGHPSFDVIRIAGVKPDLLFIVVVYMGYSFGSLYGEIVGFTSGLMHDTISSAPLGFLALPKMLIGFLAGFFGRSVIKSNLFTVMMLVFLASMVKGVVSLILAYLFHQAAVSMVLSIIIPESFYNALIAPILFYVMDKLFEKELEYERFHG